MKIHALVLGLILLLVCGACGRPSAPSAGGESSQEPASSGGGAASPTAKPQFSYVQTGDVRARPQLLSGWHAIEEGAWRWMAKDAEAVLLTPEESPVSFELRLVFPEYHMKAAGGPITVSVLFQGVLFAQETYREPGVFTVHKPVPAGSLPRPSTRVTIRLNRSVPPTGADKRELGAVIPAFGFVK